ncbi:hypothetical protein [Leuconostoc citreum]|uniref:hypothetical protein n=1 Tax=Leuconostoc citreum TaxID=33964 RepID=UPI0032E00C81
MKYRVLYNSSNKRIKLTEADKSLLTIFSESNNALIDFTTKPKPNKGIWILPYNYIEHNVITLSDFYGSLQEHYELIVFKPRQVHFTKIIERIYLFPNAMFIHAKFDVKAADDEDMFNKQLKSKYVDQVFEEINNRNVSIEKLRFRISNYTYTIENSGNVLVDSDTYTSLSTMNMLIGNALYG